MKALVLVMIITGFAGAVSARGVEVQCSDSHSISYLNGEFENGTSSLQLRHNYAVARLVCDSSVYSSVTGAVPFRCWGMWVFDINSPDLVVGTVASVTFRPQTDGAWMAEFTTSHDYGRVDLSMDCQMTAKP